MVNPTTMILTTPDETLLRETNESSVLSVEQLNRQIRTLIEGQLSLVWVQGEISNFKAHSSGHFYFSLKDSKSQIRAVMFRGHNSRLRFKPHDGMQVIVRARVTVYEPRGEYQVMVETMEPVGAGALQKAFEQLKLKLKTEGLFESSRKRALPAFPRHIVIVTSPTGAAIRDMMNVLARRNRMVPITIVPTVVQGEAAAPKICDALEKAWRIPDVDVIIIGRGGGSIEDMWCFNDETLARLIARSPVPVISAVGHEIDFTIADFVADLRAPTPSAAAELVVRNAEELSKTFSDQRRMLSMSMEKFLRHEKQRLCGLTSRLIDPKRRLQDLMIRRDELTTRLGQSVLTLMETKRLRIKLIRSRLPSPESIVQKCHSNLEKLCLKLKNKMAHDFEKKSARLHEKMAVLDTLSPLKTVDRGYSVTRLGDQVVTSIKQIKPTDHLMVRVGDGEIETQVIRISEFS